MKTVKLRGREKEIETALAQGEYRDVNKAAYEDIAHAIAARKKDAVLNIRINSTDLKNIKHKSKQLGIKYQTFISELLHRVAHS